jgi:hypothetical protein
MMSAETPSLRAVRLMRLFDRRKGVLVGMGAEQASSQRYFLIIQSILQNTAISPDVRESIRQQFDEAINDGAEPFITLTLNEMGGFLSGMRALRLNVDAEFAELSDIRRGMEEMSERNRAKVAKRKSDPNFRPSIQDMLAEFEQDGELTKLAQRLWAKIDMRIKDVLTIMAQMAPPNAKELVEAFTGEPYDANVYR